MGIDEPIMKMIKKDIEPLYIGLYKCLKLYWYECIDTYNHISIFNDLFPNLNELMKSKVIEYIILGVDRLYSPTNKQN